jgi:hypothetical protein
MVLTDQTISVGIGAAIGAGFSGMFLIVSQWLNRRFEDRRNRRELAVNAAIAYWKGETETARFRIERGLTSVRIAPLGHYIIYMMLTSKLIDRSPGLSSQEMILELQKIKQTVQDIFDAEVGGSDGEIE